VDSLRGAHLVDGFVHGLDQRRVEILGELLDHRLDLLAEAVDLGRGDLVGGDASLLELVQRRALAASRISACSSLLSFCQVFWPMTNDCGL
jgi:hypothetical protein